MEGIEWFINPKMEKDTVHVGLHTLRFKMKLVHELELKEGDILRVGINPNERPLKYFYVVKNNEADKFTGFKVTIRNKSCMISFKGMFDKLQFSRPQNCRYETFEEDGRKGIRVTLPKII
jgi:hypothetical protein